MALYIHTHLSVRVRCLFSRLRPTTLTSLLVPSPHPPTPALRRRGVVSGRAGGGAAAHLVPVRGLAGGGGAAATDGGAGGGGGRSRGSRGSSRGSSRGRRGRGRRGGSSRRRRGGGAAASGCDGAHAAGAAAGGAGAPVQQGVGAGGEGGRQHWGQMREAGGGGGRNHVRVCGRGWMRMCGYGYNTLGPLARGMWVSEGVRGGQRRGGIGIGMRGHVQAVNRPAQRHSRQAAPPPATGGAAAHRTCTHRPTPPPCSSSPGTAHRSTYVSRAASTAQTETRCWRRHGRALQTWQAAAAAQPQPPAEAVWTRSVACCVWRCPWAPRRQGPTPSYTPAPAAVAVAAAGRAARRQ